MPRPKAVRHRSPVLRQSLVPHRNRVRNSRMVGSRTEVSRTAAEAEVTRKGTDLGS